MALKIKEIPVEGYEKLIEATNEEAGLHAFIAIHSLKLGPALGGTRIYPYASTQDAITDVLRLSRGMTYKSSLAETGFGGGKSVIIADPKKQKTKELLLAFADAVNQLKGNYVCAEDSGTTTEDMMIIHQKTPYVAGLPTATGSGDPGRFTAWGILVGLKAVAQKLWNNPSLKGRTVAIQGTGSVGARLAEFLFWEEANLILTDIDEARLKAMQSLYHAQVVKPNEILQVECDILAPCAMGGILNNKTIPQLRCLAVAGAANNQLLSDADDLALAQRAILYAPDFVINAGGVINASFELEEASYNPKIVLPKVNKIYDTLLKIFEMAEQEKLGTQAMAMKLAEHKILNQIGKRKEPLRLHHS